MRLLIPKPPKKKDTLYQRFKARLFFRRRAAIEPVIGHLRHDHRMTRSSLKGVVDDTINLFLVAVAFNSRNWMRKNGDFFALLAFLPSTKTHADTWRQMWRRC